MYNIIKLPYDGFRRLLDEYKKRLFYYNFENGSIELNFLSESFIVSTIIEANKIENKELFFQQEMFYNAELLTAPMSVTLSIFNTFGKKITNTVKDNESEEQKQSNPDFNSNESKKDDNVKE